MNRLLGVFALFCVTTAHSKPAIFTTKNGKYSVALSDKTVACSGTALNTLVNADTRDNPTIALDPIETKEELDLFAQQIHITAALSAHAVAVDQEDPEKAIIKQLSPALQQLPLPVLARLFTHVDFYGVPHLLPALEKQLVNTIIQKRVPLAAQLAPYYYDDHSEQQVSETQQTQEEDQERTPLVAQRAMHTTPSWLANLPGRMCNQVLAHKVMQQHPALFFDVTHEEVLSTCLGKPHDLQCSLDGTKMIYTKKTSYLDVIVLWERIEGGKWVHVLTPPQQGQSLYGARFSPDSSKVVVASADHIAYVWQKNEFNKWEIVASLPGHTNKLNGVRFSADNNKIVTFSNDCTARVWQQNTEGVWEFVVTLREHNDKVTDAQFSPDYTKIVTLSGDEMVLWQKNERNTWVVSARRQREHAGLFFDNVQFSPDGTKILLMFLNSSTVQVWEHDHCNQRVPFTTLQGHTDRILSAQFSPDGTKILTVSADETARLWEQKEDTTWESTALLQAAGWGHSGHFSPDGTRIVITSKRWKQVHIWQQNDLGKWIVMATNEDLLGSTREGARFSPDGRNILIPLSGIRGWDLCILSMIDVVKCNEQAGCALQLQDVLPALKELDPVTQAWWRTLLSVVSGADKKSLLRGLIATINARKTTQVGNSK